ncbi:MAG: ABC transporter permease [Acidimicrobiales bacterium]
MARYIARRLVSSLVVLFLVSVFTFLIFQVIPNGNPALRIAGRGASPATLVAVVKEWGFNQPLYVQYADMMKKIFTGSVVSYSGNINVLGQLRAGLPATVSLAVGASVIWLSGAIVIGVISSRRIGGTVDRLMGVLASVSISVPVYVIGAVALYFLAYKVSIFPNGGYVPISQSFFGWLDHMILPWLCLSVGFIGLYSRVLRSSIIETEGEDFVRTAKAKGLTKRRILVHHVLRTSMIPIISLWGLDFAGVIGGGAILIETLFNLQGVGQYAAESIGLLDIPPIMVIVMYGTFFVVLLTTAVDILHAFAEPRVRLQA